MYNGQLKKGAFLFFSLFFFNVIFGISNATHYFYGLATLFAIEIFLRIYIIIDAIEVEWLENTGDFVKGTIIDIKIDK